MPTAGRALPSLTLASLDAVFAESMKALCYDGFTHQCEAHWAAQVGVDCCRMEIDVNATLAQRPLGRRR